MATLLDNAVNVLADAGRPMHFREIAQLIAEAAEDYQPDEAVPEEALYALIEAEIKQSGIDCRFRRTRAGTYVLQRAHSDSDDATPVDEELSGRRVRTPLFPTYSDVKSILPVWNGRPRSQVTGLRAKLQELWGSPQEPVDWTDPDAWISERLEGAERELAEAVWTDTGRTVNPRHTHGAWLFARGHELLRATDEGVLETTQRGEAFINDDHDTVLLLDELEGLLKLLDILVVDGPGRVADFAPIWGEYLAQYSGYGTESTIKDTLRRRLVNLIDRGLAERDGWTYRITVAGIQHVGRGKPDGGGPDEAADSYDVGSLRSELEARLRQNLRYFVREMNPIAFEHLIQELLNEMGYQNTMVTSPSNDGGVDVIGDIEVGITSVHEVIQAKRHRANIQRTVLDALRGSLHRFDAVRGTIITTGDFSDGTKKAAFERGAPPITLINGERLVDLLIEHSIGVTTRYVSLLEIDANELVNLATVTSEGTLEDEVEEPVPTEA